MSIRGVLLWTVVLGICAWIIAGGALPNITEYRSDFKIREHKILNME